MVRTIGHTRARAVLVMEQSVIVVRWQVNGSALRVARLAMINAWPMRV
jgi:hypothetical protein